MSTKPIAWRLVGPASRLGLGVAVATFVIDQLHKAWMIYIYGIVEKQRVTITPFFDLVFTINRGVSYSMLTMDGLKGQLLLAVFAVTVALALAIWIAQDGQTRLVAASLGLIVGGALGNALDRLHYGGVADFFSLHAFGFYWYVFNIADVAIVAGVVGLVYDSIVVSRRGGTDSASKPS
jgi:signal peptidase II